MLSTPTCQIGVTSAAPPSDPLDDFPPLDAKVITGDIAFHQHPLGHPSRPAWETFYTFASKYLKK
jgi:hypothetical protein